MKKWRYCIVILILFMLLVLPAASAGEGKIAFVSYRDGIDSEIFVMDANGANPIQLTDNLEIDISPTWSPDTTKIAFESSRYNGLSEIFVMDANGANPTQLTVEGYNHYPAWSPDGTKIAWSSWRDSDGNYDIYVMDANGANPIRLTDNPAEDEEPTWSPDGTKIAFSSCYRNSGVNCDIFVMDANGANPTQLTMEGYNLYPAWSPDGTKIAWCSDIYSNGNGDIYVMDTNGANPIRLTDNLADDNHPTWSPDGTKIAFSSNRDGIINYEIYVMDTNGANPTRLTDNPASDSEPEWSRSGIIPPPVAAFEATPTSGAAPLKVTFTDKSTGDGITSRQWQYKLNSATDWMTFSLDGTSSFIFNKPGNYDIKLTVTNLIGSDDEIKENYISLPVTVLLTFDDGPDADESPSSTTRVLDTLKTNTVQNDIVAVFFVLTHDNRWGGRVPEGENLLNREIVEGHIVAIHAGGQACEALMHAHWIDAFSAKHTERTRKPAYYVGESGEYNTVGLPVGTNGLESDLVAAINRIRYIFNNQGYNPEFVRPPMYVYDRKVITSYNSVTVRNALGTGQGLKLILTDVWGDGGGVGEGKIGYSGEDDIMKRFDTALDKGLSEVVITLHDSNDVTSYNLAGYLEKWTQNGKEKSYNIRFVSSANEAREILNRRYTANDWIYRH